MRRFAEQVWDQLGRLQRVAVVLGFDAQTWPLVEQDMDPSMVHLFPASDELPSVAEAGGNALPRLTLTVWLHQLSLLLSIQYTTILKQQVQSSSPTQQELHQFFDGLCTGLRRLLRQCSCFPENLAQMLRTGLLAVGWTVLDPVQQPDRKHHVGSKENELDQDNDEAAFCERELARHLDEMKAIVDLSLGQPPVEICTDADRVRTDAEVLRNAQELLMHMDRYIGLNQPSTNGDVTSCSFGLRPSTAGQNDLANFLSEAIHLVHSLRAKQYTLQSPTTCAVTEHSNGKRPVGIIVAHLIHLLVKHIGGDVDSELAFGHDVGRVRRHLLEAFRFFDRTGKGKIFARELYIAMCSLSSPTDTSPIDADGVSGPAFLMKETQMFVKQSDTNTDDSLDHAEFIAYFHFHHINAGRIAAQKQKVEHQAHLALERSEANKLLKERDARMSAAQAAAAAEIAAKEQTMAFANNQRCILPSPFSKPYWSLGLAHEAAASRLGFTAESWPLLPHKAVANKVRLRIDSAYNGLSCPAWPALVSCVWLIVCVHVHRHCLM